ncbi:hypothetical protein F3J20_16050 [Paraburkholderia sp. Cy-641]|uniref:hypothetical protein n=1 Tax=Paraburkholderia sp. Cy-641 TaxID=2608337 RepID=UPI00141E29F9|nr:hypothetical protein [Paraburkholderia sp. Cy-641]NIF78880.1 hypothetical protein [Paraburkholderia sp. Cy-641]
MTTSVEWSTLQQVHAAWVQAIGSIGAILVAILVPAALWFLDRRRARNAEAARLKAVAAITRLAIDALASLSREVRPNGLPGVTGVTGVNVELLHSVTNAADAVDSIEIEKLGSATLVLKVATVRRCIRRARGLVPEMLPPTGEVLIVPYDFAALLHGATIAQLSIEEEVCG